MSDKNDQVKASTSVTTSNKSESLSAASQQPTSTFQQNNGKIKFVHVIMKIRLIFFI